MKRVFYIFLAASLIVFSVSQVKAAEDRALENVFKDSSYGAAIGGLLGAAIMVFTDRPIDHLNYIAYGLAGGVIGGTLYGLVLESRYFTEIDHGKVMVSIPRPELQISNHSGVKKVFINLPFIRYHF